MSAWNKVPCVSVPIKPLFLQNGKEMLKELLPEREKKSLSRETPHNKWRIHIKIKCFNKGLQSLSGAKNSSSNRSSEAVTIKKKCS